MSGPVAELLFETANLAVLGVGLGYLLFRPVHAALASESQQRADREKELASREAEIAEKSSELRREREGQAARLAAEEESVRASARQEAEAIVSAARKQSEQALVAWEEERTQREAEAEQAAASSSARMAARAAAQLLQTIQGPELELALARAALARLRSPIAGHTWVEVAVDPSDEVREVLRAALPADFEVRIRPELLAGLRIGTDAGLVDCSASGMTRAAEVAGA